MDIIRFRRRRDDWQKWEFPELTEALKKWADQNPSIFHSNKNRKQYNLYHSKENREHSRTEACVYCENEGHKFSERSTVSKVSDHRLKLSWKNCVSIVQSQNRRLLNVRVQKRVSIFRQNTTPLYEKKQQICFSLQTIPLSYTQFS